ncbi:protein obstructor-E-like [Anopheles arabiensis]|uniref:Chitin-binding type-2 domain-containing protein n=1 Tax=Anopheles arabiensis TaxID=7173 RepID=A0A182I410_ANOAR|nr:protein obstructor-E-like [Anopheles arabiensis]
MATAIPVLLLLVVLGAIPSLTACEHGSRAALASNWLSIMPNHWMCAIPKTSTLFPHYSDCTRYYECVCNDAYEYECPDGLRFNPRKLRCEESPLCPEAGAGVDPEQGPPEPQTDCEEASRVAVASDWLSIMPNHWMCEIPKTSTLFPHYSDCTRYYKCVCNTAYEYECPEGLGFNQRTLRCEKSSHCAGAEEEEANHSPAVPDHGALDPRCPSRESVKAWTDEQNCSKYYQCAGGQVLDMHCPESLVYDSAAKRCTLPNPDKCCAPVPAAPVLEREEVPVPVEPTLEEQEEQEEVAQQEEEQAEEQAEEQEQEHEEEEQSEGFWGRLQSWFG